MSEKVQHRLLERPVEAQFLLESRCSNMSVADPSEGLRMRLVLIIRMTESGWQLVTSSSWVHGDRLLINDTFRWGSTEASAWMESVCETEPLAAIGGA